MTHQSWRLSLLGLGAALALGTAGLKSLAAPADNGVTAREARQKNPIPPTEENLAAGKRLYQKQCGDCHGAAGKGDGKSAVDLDPKPSDLSQPEVANQSDGVLFWRITRGRKPMPGFEKTISKEDRWRVVLFIRTLQPPQHNGESWKGGKQRADF
jgi:mono/diheme cytochrome c family protein